MKTLLILLSLSFLILKPGLSLAKIQIVTTLPSLGALAAAIGGDQVKVKSLVRGNQDAHFLEARPSFVVTLSKADLLIHNGMGLEDAWLNPVILQSKNSKIQIGKAGYLDASIAINPLEIPLGRVDRSLGDIHPQGNPHYLLDPRNHLLIANLISQKLAKLDPQHANHYQSKKTQVEKTLRPKIKNWQERIKKSFKKSSKKIITYHRSFSYFAHWLGLKVAAQVEPLPGIPPHARHSQKLVELIKTEKIPILLMASHYPKKVPQYLKSKTGISLLISPIDAKEAKLNSVIEYFENLIKQLEKGA